MADSTAQVIWRGDLESGRGSLERVGSGAFGGLPVTWKARTGEEGGLTTPEELLAAAHAACFSMALSLRLAKAGTPAEELSVSATVTFVPGTGITASALTVDGRVPGLDPQAFAEHAAQAKEGCPVSRALAGNVELSVTARLA
ncbi:MAG: OsmC family peroxiredoxin [Actinomycetota bacterium]|jgi:osmotically inducible protein OsmC|nr:MAG: OsmC family peroxiredoxin [Actinomycetota bacterium]